MSDKRTKNNIKSGLSRAKSPRRMSVAGPIVLLATCVIGMIVSGLSTWDHIRFRITGGVQEGICAALADTGCRAAHSSEYSEILGIPISHLGTAFYFAAATLALAALIFRRRRSTSTIIETGVAPVVAAMGLGSVVYSIFLASLLVRYKEACPFCIVLYVVNAAILVIGIIWWIRGQRRMPLRALLAPFAIAAVSGTALLAVTTPFLLNALSEAKRPVVAAADSGPKTASLPVLPARIPGKGSPQAQNDLVEFSDFECPYCSVLHDTVASIFEERGPSGLRVRFVNYPLDRECNPYVSRTLHPTACLSARGGICAQEQNRFWPFAGESFALRGARSREVILDTGRKVGLDMDRFANCLDAERTDRALAEDIALAHEAGVRATPTLFVNGEAFQGAVQKERLTGLLDSSQQ